MKRQSEKQISLKNSYVWAILLFFALLCRRILREFLSSSSTTIDNIDISSDCPALPSTPPSTETRPLREARHRSPLTALLLAFSLYANNNSLIIARKHRRIIFSKHGRPPAAWAEVLQGGILVHKVGWSIPLSPIKTALDKTRTEFVQRPAADEITVTKHTLSQRLVDKWQLNLECWIPPRR